MRPIPIDPLVHRPTKMAATEPARLALAMAPLALSRPRATVVRIAGTLWCRDLQFPTVRAIGERAGYRSTSTVLNGFGHLSVLHARVINAEWWRIEAGWLRRSPADRPAWLVEHATELAWHGPARLRLPALVCSAVVGSGALVVPPSPLTLAPLYALAAFADGVDRPGTSAEIADLRPVVRALAHLDLSALTTELTALSA